MGEFSHLDDRGQARMVDVGDKAETRRVAIAEGLVAMPGHVRDRLFGGDLPKGDALAVARVAGIAAAKRTGELIPLCHPLALSHVAVDIDPVDDGAAIRVRVETVGRTGVEMEAMTAAAVAGLTLYDMVKGVERSVELRAVRLIHKSGGKSGEWNR